jgi:predicted dehydrogenase
MIDPFNDDKDIVDNQVAILEFASGVRATFHTNANAALPERRFYIVGTRGTIRADARAGRLEVHFVDPRAEPRHIEVEGRGGHAGGDETMVAEVAETLLEGAAPVAGMREGLFSLVAALGIDAALDTGEVHDLAPFWERANRLLGSALETPLV